MSVGITIAKSVSKTNETSDTLVSCFPTDEPLCRPDEGTSSDPNNMDVMASAITVADLESCENTFGLFAILTHRSVNRIFEESKGGYVDLLSTYRWAAANKVSEGLNTAARHLCEGISATLANYLGSSSYGTTGAILHASIG